MNNLLHFQFTEGDAWILLGAFCFAVYNTLVRKKPVGISPVNFLFIIFCLGTLLLLPFFLWEMQHQPGIRWNPGLFGMLLYLGIPASVISYWCWNLAIGRLGAGRTALFGNLIPIFASLEAAILLSETFTMTHIISMILVFAGILIANWKIIAGRS